MKDEFVSDDTFMGVNCTQELQLFGDHYFILGKGMTVLGKKRKKQTAIYIFLSSLKKLGYESIRSHSIKISQSHRRKLMASS